MKTQVAIVGGAGYVGSHTALALKTGGHEAIVYDNLSTGHAEFLRFGAHEIGDLNSPETLDAFFAAHDINTVMHFAACCYVGESVTDPAKYYRNNIVNTINLLDSCRKHKVRNFVFSSTCAVYGVPHTLPLTEKHPQQPINPYGRTKLAVEWMLKDYAAAYGLRVCCLRYFNAAGAAPASLGADIGEWHEPETHLIPLVLGAAGKADAAVKIFGTDYDTPDGSCIRDYVHVCDLADAHVLAMRYLESGGGIQAFNLSAGRGYSVREVIDCAKTVTGLPVRVEEAPRRPGDPPSLMGDASLARTELGWKPRYSDLKNIMETAWAWEQNMPGKKSSTVCECGQEAAS